MGPRIKALIVMVIGVVLVMVNHQTIQNERHFYPGLILFGPVCVLTGLGGVIDSRILAKAGAVPDPGIVFRLANLGLAVSGLAIGWSLAHFLYKIW